MTRFWTSDTHFGHAKICEYAGRPFGSIDEMNDQLVDNWNSVVADGDDVHVIGDICMGQRETSLKVLERLNGTIHLTPGNHDYVHPSVRPKLVEKWTGPYTERMRVSPVQWSTMIGDIEFDVCHFPFANNGTNGFVTDSHDDDRYTELRPIDNGQHLICGHSHVGPDLAVQGGRMVNVGVDAWHFMPISDEQILAALN